MAVNQAAPEATLEAVRQAMRACAPRAPQRADRVYKDECSFSFATPLSPGGLYINLHSWQSYGADYVQLDHQRTGNRLYLFHKQARARGRAPAAPSAPLCCWADRAEVAHR